MLRIGVAGALGRMGREIVALIGAREDMVVAARIARPGAGESPSEAPPLSLAAEALALCDVIVDVSTGAAAAALARLAAERGGPALVIGATGFTAKDEAEIAAAARTIPILKAGNFSLGVALLAHLVELTSARLGAADWDIEIIEAHHRAKRDAPSGTALSLGAAAARGRGEVADLALPPRQGVSGPRPAGGIGYAVVRGGGLVGEHSVIFAAEDEILTLSHSARDRRVFARGALAAAAFIAQAKPGLYGMDAVVSGA